jgi:hypothetical protein
LAHHAVLANQVIQELRELGRNLSEPLRSRGESLGLFVLAMIFYVACMAAVYVALFYGPAFVAALPTKVWVILGCLGVGYLIWRERRP